MQQRSVIILGGGFSGSAVALQLARQPGPLPGTVHLVEPRALPGPGLAYSAPRPEYLLNVRTPFLSAFPDEPAHFAEWLHRTGAPPAEHGFCSRQTYGRYLQAMLRDVLHQPAPNGLAFRQYQQAATQVTVAADGQTATVQLADGTRLRGDKVVLALGNFPPPNPAGIGDYLHHPGFHGNPWAAGALQNIGPDEGVLLVGSGLTAVDVLLGLRATGHRAPVTVVSRHQRWPAVHGPQCESYPSFFAEALQGLDTVGAVLAAVRRRVRQAAAQGLDWRPVFDSLRPHLGSIWAAWPLEEQARFLRHLAPVWTVLRHRSPPQNGAILHEMQASGQLLMRSGRVRHIEPDGENLRVALQHRSQQTWLRSRHVINCTGPLLDYSRIQEPLVSHLRAEGLLVPDALRLGIRTDAHGALLDTRQRPSAVLFTLGSSRRPACFESTAVPELRQQAADLVQELARRW